MRKELDISSWNRKQHYEHFMMLADPFFATTIQIDVTAAYNHAKTNKVSFFACYLHACMKAINAIENFKFRIEDDKVYVYDEIAASATIARPDNTYGFSFICYSEEFSIFNANFLKERERIVNSTDLFPPVNSADCVYCSAIPWLNFTGHKETFAGNNKDSIPRLAFGKVVKEQDRLLMPMAVSVNHALVDGYHVGLFVERLEEILTKF